MDNFNEEIRRGGSRPGAGRPKGSKNKIPINTVKINNKNKNEEEVQKINEEVNKANKEFSNNLSGEMKKLYLGFSKRQKLPLDDLRELAQSMKARYNIGLQSELKAHESKIKLAKEEIKDIEETELLHGRKSTKGLRDNRIRKLKSIILSKYHISSSLTTLSAELKNLFVEIERIEAGQPKGNMNIFHILQGKGDPEKNKQLEDVLFEEDPSVYDGTENKSEEINDD